MSWSTLVITHQPSWSSCSPLQPAEANQIMAAPVTFNNACKGLEAFDKRYWGYNSTARQEPEGLEATRRPEHQNQCATVYSRSLQRTLLLESHRATKMQIPKFSLQHNLLLKSVSLQDIPTEFYVNILFCLSSWDKNITFWVNILSMIHMRTSIHFTLLNSLLTLSHQTAMSQNCPAPTMEMGVQAYRCFCRFG